MDETTQKLIEELISDHKKFNDYVYTSAEDAVKESKRRLTDDSIKIPFKIPEECVSGMKSILYVAVITPNNEIRRYIEIAKELGFSPLVFEQLGDKFSTNNQWKHALGKLSFCSGRGKKGGLKCERLNVIDFNTWNGKKISDVKTLWGQSLVDFHHELFFKAFPHLTKENLFDGTNWFLQNGSGPKEYYKAFLYLLIKHGVQFENFYLDEMENQFTREIFLPAFISVYRETGLKPLIIALEPTESEGDEFWYSHPQEDLGYVKDKMK